MPTEAIPANRDYYAEGARGSDAYRRLADTLFQNYSNNASNYGQSDLNSLAGMYGLSEVGKDYTLADINRESSNIANAQTAAALEAQQKGVYTGAEKYGADMLGLLKQYNPEQYTALTAANQMGTAAEGSLGGDLRSMAQQQLALGAGLSDEQTRNATQAAREAWGARGLINSPGAVGAEVLNRDAYGQQLLAQRQGFANTVNQGLTGNAISNAGLQTQSAFNPLNAFFGLGTQNAGTNAGIMGAGTNFSAGRNSNQFLMEQGNPWNAYNNDVEGSNFNAGNARYISAGNNAAAIQGANTQAGADFVKAFLGLMK
jgi:hypothetical protein